MAAKQVVHKSLKPVLSEITDTNDYKKELERLSKEYSKFKPLYPRKLQTIHVKNRDKTQLSLMQFNILADGLSGVLDPDNKDGKGFIRSPIKCLHWKFRGFRIVEEIARFAPNIVTMEEVDRFRFIEHYLKPLNYSGVHVPKSKSPCVRVGNDAGFDSKPDGVAIFYDRRLFTLCDKYPFGAKFENKPAADVPALCLHLQFKDKPKSDFLVVATHLKSAKNAEGETKRLNQLSHLMPSLLTIQTDLEKKAGHTIPLFLGCDLNAPNKNTKGFSPYAYKSVTNGEQLLKDDKAEKKESEKPTMPGNYTANWGLNMSSAYANGLLVGKGMYAEPKYTTWKARSKGIDQHTIDYIFFQKHKNVDVSSLLDIPLEKEVNQDTLLPGWEYPSDHFAIMAAFQY